MRRLPVLVVALPIALAGCSAAVPPSASAPPSASPPIAESSPPTDRARTPVEIKPLDQALHDELIGMLERDQSDRRGGPPGEGPQARTDRLREIVVKHGWPTISLVGEEGEDAASTIAQHSDHDLAFQEFALGFLSDAVEAGQASSDNLAYLSDRISVAKGEPQKYGTQVGCSTYGPLPSTPLDDPVAVAERRAAAGMDPLPEFLAERATICARELDDR